MKGFEVLTWEGSLTKAVPEQSLHLSKDNNKFALFSETGKCVVFHIILFGNLDANVAERASQVLG